MNHIEIKHEVKKINRKSDFLQLLDDSMLNEKEKQFMKLFYIDSKSIDVIADEMGYTRSGILRMHKRCLKNLESLL